MRAKMCAHETPQTSCQTAFSDLRCSMLDPLHREHRSISPYGTCGCADSDRTDQPTILEPFQRVVGERWFLSFGQSSVQRNQFPIHHSRPLENDEAGTCLPGGRS